MTLDQIFEDPDALKIMSPAWRAPHSREAMILRKMRNNAIKKIPKDFSDAFMAKAYESTFEDYDQYRDDRIDKEGAVDAEVAEQAGSRPFLNRSRAYKRPRKSSLMKPRRSLCRLTRSDHGIPLFGQLIRWQLLSYYIKS